MNFAALLNALTSHQVRFIVIGGVAAAIHGTARVTFDLDVVYDRALDNLERLAHALEPLHPYLRGAPAGLPFRLDSETLQRGLNFTLRTDAGDIDLLGEVTGSVRPAGPRTQKRSPSSKSCSRSNSETVRRMVLPAKRLRQGFGGQEAGSDAISIQSPL